MDKVNELKIDSTLWATPSTLVNLLDFKPNKISVKTESNTKNDIKVDYLLTRTNKISIIECGKKF